MPAVCQLGGVLRGFAMEEIDAPTSLPDIHVRVTSACCHGRESLTMPEVQSRVILTNKMGLHARPSTQIAQVAGRFDADIAITKDGLAVDAKSVLELLMLAAECGSELVVTANGDDAESAVEELVTLIEGRFGELEVDG